MCDKNDSSFKKKSEKIATSSTKSNKKKRQQRKSFRYRKKEKFARDEVDYDDFFNAKLPWNCTDKSKTPLVVLSNRELNHLRKNCVVLKQMRIVNENKQDRKIFYDDLEYLGNNVVTKKANDDVIVKLPETKRNFFCILGLVKDVKKFCKGVELFCSRGYRINTMAWMSPYTLLCFACARDSWKKSGCLHVDKEQLSIVSKFMTNQELYLGSNSRNALIQVEKSIVMDIQHDMMLLTRKVYHSRNMQSNLT